MNIISKYKLPALFLVLLLLTSTDTVLFGTNSNKAFLYVSRAMGLLAFLLLPLFMKGNNSKGNGQLNIICIFLSCIILVSATINEDEIPTTLSKLISVLAGWAIAKYYSFSSFHEIFESFVYYITIVAIITEVISYVVPGLFSFFPVIENAANLKEYVFFIGSIPLSSLELPLIRAQGPFWEAGAFSAYLIWALYIQLFINEKVNARHFLVLLIGLFITFSTAGFLTFIVLALAFIFSNKKGDPIYVKLKRGTVFLILLMGVYMIFSQDNILYETVFGKLQGDETELASTSQTRFSSIVNGITAFLMNPILGGGSKTEDLMAIVLASSAARFESGGTLLTNTVIGNFVCFGVFFGLIFLIGSIRYIRYFTKQSLVFWILVVAFMMNYSGERFFSFIPFVFMFYGLKKTKVVK